MTRSKSKLMKMLEIFSQSGCNASKNVSTYKSLNTFSGSEAHLHKIFKEFWLEFLQNRYDLVSRL